MAEALPGRPPAARTSRRTSAPRWRPARRRRATPGSPAPPSREMEGMARAGLGEDLLLANEVADATRLGALARPGARVTVAVDSDATIAAAARAGVPEVLDRRQRRPAPLRLLARGRRPPGRPRPAAGPGGARRHGLRGPRRRAGGPGDPRRRCSDDVHGAAPRRARRGGRGGRSRPAAPAPTTSTPGPPRSRPAPTRSWTRPTASSACRSPRRSQSWPR